MKEKTKIRIGHLQITDHLVLGVTKSRVDNGQENLQYCSIENIPMVGWNEVGEALKSDEIDMAFILAPYAMELFHSGVKMKLILLGHRSGSIIVINKRANIEKIEDFKGKTFLIPHYLSIHHMLFDKLVNEKGLTTGVGKDVIFEVVAPSQIPKAIEYDETGVIGGYIVAEPYGTQVVKAGFGKEFILSKDIWPNHPCCVVVAKDDVINKNEDAIYELTKAFVNSGNFISDNVNESAKIGAEFLNQDYDVIHTVLTQPPDRVVMKELFPVIEDFDIIQKYLTEKISAMSDKIDLEKFVDTRFAKEAGAK